MTRKWQFGAEPSDCHFFCAMPNEATAAEIDQAIVDSAVEGIRSVSVDGLTVSGHSLRDLIDAKKFLDTGNSSVNLPARGLRFTRLIPQGGGGAP